MSSLSRRAAGKLLFASTLLIALAAPAMPQQTLPSEMPATFVPRVEGFDYTKREEMIPMRDGVKLQTVILIPRGAHRAPILLSRTPYGATSRIASDVRRAFWMRCSTATMWRMMPVLNGAIFAALHGDVRGKHGSEGDYVMTRPLHGPLNPTAVDHSTDTYDTRSIGSSRTFRRPMARVGISSAFHTMASPHRDGTGAIRHPALRAAIPINAMVDGWDGG